MAVQSKFYTDRNGAAMAKLRERDGDVDPSAPDDMKPLLRHIAQRVSALNDVPGQQAMREIIAGGGDSDDVEVATSKFENKIPNWSNTYGKGRINP